MKTPANDFQPKGPRIPQISIVVVTYNSTHLLRECLRGWLDAGVPPNHIVLVDNASTISPNATARTLGVETILTNPENLGFAAAVNAGLTAATALPEVEWVLVLNPDTAVTDVDLLRSALTSLEQVPRSVEMVIPLLPTPGGGFRPNLQPYPTTRELRRWILRPRQLTRTVPTASLEHGYAIGSVLLLRSDAWKRLGGLDPSYFLYGEDVAFSKKCATLGTQTLPMALPLRHSGNTSLRQLPRTQRTLMLQALVDYNVRQYGSHAGHCARALLACGWALRAVAALIHRERGELITALDLVRQALACEVSSFAGEP